MMPVSPDQDYAASYSIVRFHQDDNHPDHGTVVASGLSLEEARAHCQDDATHGDGWFDGYREE